MCTDNTNQIANRINPWPGLSSYKDPATITKVPFAFCGRDKEKRDLYNLVNSNILVTLYGKSGLGKTSLLNAGVFPLLRESQYFPINIRLGIVPEKKSLQDTIREAIESNLKNRGGEIIELSAVIKEYDLVYTETLSSDYLWAYFASHKFIDSKGNDLTIVLAFDQFEEILYSRSNDALLLLQQMLYMMNDNNNLPPFEDDGIIYSYNTNFRFIISIREDNLFMLEDVIDNNYLQAMKKNRYRLKEITLEGAKDVVKIPGYGCIDEKDEDAIVDRIVNEAQDDDGTISSLMISFLCNRLFAQVQDTGGVITLQQVEECGSETLEEFCRQQLSLLPDNEFDLFTKHLITEDGRRKIIDISTFSQDVPSGMFLLDEKTRLLHTFKISTNKEKQVEIIHDRFSVIVLAIKEEISERKKTEETLRAYEKERIRLEAEKEEQRLARNRIFNHQKRLKDLNVLTQKGRRLLDNALDFGEYQTLKKCLGRNSIDRMLFLQGIWVHVADDLFKDYKAEGDIYTLFDDPLLDDATFRMSFMKHNERICTTDGIYAVSIRYSKSKVSDIWFYEKNMDGSINYKKPVYIYGGFCGIHIDYDENNREVRRMFLGDDGRPVVCMDGYSIIEKSLDADGNPVQTRYYKMEGDSCIPCSHIHGNYGFDSLYDSAGNEIERIFVNKEGKPTKIVSGVYGKRMKYDSESFLLIELSNLDENRRLIEDLDGYVTVRYKYDKDGRQNSESYFDREGKPWNSTNNVHEIITIYNQDDLSAKQYNCDKVGEFINDKEGICCISLSFNTKQQFVLLRNLDKNGNAVSDSDGISEHHYDYDKLNRLNQIKFYNPYASFVKGYVLDFNKEGFRVVRMWNIDANGEIIINSDYGDDNYPVYAVEIEESDDSQLASMMRFTNKNNQLIPCCDGYLGVKRWEDNKERVKKEFFYDADDSLMCDKQGVFGHIFEYINDSETKIINIDSCESPIEDKDGVCYVISTQKKDYESQFNFDKDGHPAIGKGYFGYSIETFHLEDSILKITKLLNASNNIINDSYKEETFDLQNRLVKSCNKNINNEIIPDEDGDYIVQKTYSSDGLSVVTTILDINGIPCNGNNGFCKIKEIHDTKDRIVNFFAYDVNGSPLELNDGSFGKEYVYEEGGRKETIFLGRDGNPANNNEGVAFLYESYDNKGRLLSQRKINAEGELVGDNGNIVREFVNTENRNCAYFLHWLDSNQELSPDGACYYRYQEEDAFGRVVKRSYFGKKMEPVCDNDDNYGELISYDDNDIYLRVYTFLDKNGMPHNNKHGYSVLKRWTDEQERVTKELFFTIENKPCMIGNESFGFIYDYLPNGAKITAFLDESGNVHNNDDGYAYKEELISAEGSEEYYYDVNLHCVIPFSDDLGDYGKRKIQTEDGYFIISLDSSGSPHINKKGYMARGVVTMEGGTIIFRNLDKDFNPVMDDYGDYATAVEILDDGLLRKEISLDKNSVQHNNLYGFACSIKTTDYAGRELLIWYDNSGNQVVPRKSKKAYTLELKRFIKERSTKNSASQFAFNERQIGATNSVILVRQELGGLAKKHGLKGTFVLLKLMDWSFYDETKKLTEIIPLIKDSEKRLVLLPIALDGPNLLQVGDIISVNLPKGKLGFRFVDWNVNQQTYETIRDKMNQLNE